MKQMKRFINAALACCILVAFVACSKGVKTGYIINGEVEGLKDGTVLTLTVMNHDDEAPMAETTIKDGKFRFEGSTEEPICANIEVKNVDGKLSVMLGDGEFSVKAKVNAKDGNSYKWQATFSGSELNDTLAAYEAHYDSLNIFYDDFMRNHGETIKKFRSMNEEQQKEFMKTEEYLDAYGAQKRFFDLVEKTVLDMVIANQNTFWGPLLAMKYYTKFTPDQHDLYEMFPDDVKKTYYGKLMGKDMPAAEAPIEITMPTNQQ